MQPSQGQALRRKGEAEHTGADGCRRISAAGSTLLHTQPGGHSIGGGTGLSQPPCRAPVTRAWAMSVPSGGGGAAGMAVATTTLQLVGAAGR